MAPSGNWQDPRGLEFLNELVKKLIPQWKDGLRAQQDEVIAYALDGEDVLYCNETGGGKSAAFLVPILVHREIARNTSSYPDLPQFRVRQDPIGIVVTPTKGLAGNIVSELAKFGVPALAYSHNTITEARKAGRKLHEEIASCKHWNIICVDPEHLRDKEWRQIISNELFRTNLVYACAEEAHLINEWGTTTFRPLFREIGAFFRGRLPADVAIIALTATLQPGESTLSVCKSLGLVGDAFHLVRRSNERRNTHFILEPLEDAISGDYFPQLLQYLSSGRKTIIHCGTIDLVWRIYVYLWRIQTPTTDRLRRVRMYHSLCPEQYNEQTLYILDNDPYCQVVIATVAFANGINVRVLLDSISVGFPSTFDQTWQEKGRAGRMAEMVSRGIVLYQKTLTAAARKLMTDLALNKNVALTMDYAKARVLTEVECLHGCINKIFQNPPLTESALPCEVAGRLRCSICLKRDNVSPEFVAPPYPPGTDLPPPFPMPPSASRRKPNHKYTLKKKEQKGIKPLLIAFGDTVWKDERHRQRHRPRSAFFATSIVDRLLKAQFLKLTADELNTILRSEHWPFLESHADRLFTLLVAMQDEITGIRNEEKAASLAKQRAKRAATRAARDEVELETDTEESTEVPARTTRKRPPLDPVTNEPAAKRSAPRAAKAPTQSYKEVMASFGPQRNNNRSSRRVTNENN